MREAEEVMTTPDPTSAESVVDASTDVVSMTVPADVAYVSTLRLTAASLAARCDLTVDDIEDLRLAVDEACALLLPHASAGAVISAHFELTTGQLRVDTSVATDDVAEPNKESFAWTVLGALTTDLDVRQQDGMLTIALTKTREAAQR
jgi:serine/threonine-protein kinase RsbW